MHDDKNNLQPPANGPGSRLPHANEIDLIDILRFLIKQRFFILAVTLFTTFAATLYCFFASPQYVAKAVIRELTPFDLATLNSYVATENNLNPKQVFSQIADNLKSQS